MISPRLAASQPRFCSMYGDQVDRPCSRASWRAVRRSLSACPNDLLAMCSRLRLTRARVAWSNSPARRSAGSAIRRFSRRLVVAAQDKQQRGLLGQHLRGLDSAQILQCTADLAHRRFRPALQEKGAGERAPGLGHQIRAARSTCLGDRGTQCRTGQLEIIQLHGRDTGRVIGDAGGHPEPARAGGPRGGMRKAVGAGRIGGGEIQGATGVIDQSSGRRGPGHMDKSARCTDSGQIAVPFGPVPIASPPKGQTGGNDVARRGPGPEHFRSTDNEVETLDLVMAAGHEVVVLAALNALGVEYENRDRSVDLGLTKVQLVPTDRWPAMPGLAGAGGAGDDFVGRVIDAVKRYVSRGIPGAWVPTMGRNRTIAHVTNSDGRPIITGVGSSSGSVEPVSGSTDVLAAGALDGPAARLHGGCAGLRYPDRGGGHRCPAALLAARCAAQSRPVPPRRPGPHTFRASHCDAVAGVILSGVPGADRRHPRNLQ